MAVTQRGVDLRRALLVAALPRVGVLCAVVAASAGDQTTTAGVLGAALLALSGVTALAAGLADGAVAAGAWRRAAPLLHAPDAHPSPPGGSLLACGDDPVIHQSVLANAVLALGTWPPPRELLGPLHRHLAGLGLDEVVERMPSGLAQPLGETGWRLSQGERARMAVLRALIAEPDAIELDGIIDALDPATAERVLAHVDAAVAATRTSPAGEPA